MPDFHDEARVKDGGTIEVNTLYQTTPTKKYRVTDRAGLKARHCDTCTCDLGKATGIFKNGQLYKPGKIIELSDLSAKGYLELGEVENVE